jgi:N-acetylglucosamine kinase-like BadF-type ATPase
MILIADCGSTKCDWLVIQAGQDQSLENTVGFSPYFHSTAEIRTIIETQLLIRLDSKQVDAVYFYGTGVHDAFRAGIVEAALKQVFSNAQIEVEHDLLASARATCGRNAGIACILGTGSNSCYYDGNEIVDNVTSLGWLLGDEGSGTYMGKALLRAMFYRELPADLNQAFRISYPEGAEAILKRIYEKGANAYLATFTRFLGDHLNHPFISGLVHQCISDFFERQVSKYPVLQQVPVHFVGSIAHHFQEILLKCMEERQLKPGVIIRKPIYQLADYHLSHTTP